VRGVFVSSVLESGPVAQLLIKANPVFQATLADLGQSARHSEGTGSQSRADHPKEGLHSCARMKAVPLARGEFPRHACRALAPLLAPICETISFANMIDRQSCRWNLSFNRPEPLPR